MSRTLNAFTVLQAIAAVASLAIILWSLGFPVLRFAEAANVTSFSNTLSDSAPSVVSDHKVEFVTPTGVAAGETIVLTFESGFSGFGSIAETDLDLEINGSDATLAAAPSGATWGAVASADTITFTSGTGVAAANATITVEIGTNADSGTNQLTNPTAGSYEINVTAGSVDSGETRVAIVDAVTVTATVDTIFTFTVNSVGNGVAVGGTYSTGGPTTPTAIPFGELEADTASTAAQSLEVSTNASNGFVVTVATDQQLTSNNGADIDAFVDGSFTTTPTAWPSLSPNPALENTWGHWGVSSDDTTLGATVSTDTYADGSLFVAASSTPVEVFRHDGPTDGSVNGEGTADVIYRVEVSELQEAADDYTATLTYVATPVF